MKYIRTIFILIILLGLSFSLVSANYTGPNRTVTITVYQRNNCSYRATVPSVPSAGQCTLNNIYSSPGSCPSTGSVAGYFNNASTACGSGWPGTCGSTITCNITNTGSSTESCSPGQPGCTGVSQTISYPAATISNSVACSQPGNGGWCRGTAVLTASGSEPVGGYSITAIESNLGVLCGSSSCTWTAPEGISSITDWAVSNFGDTSNSATITISVDTGVPAVSLSIPSPNGSGGWNRSPVTVSASGSDSNSGFASASINGGGSSMMINSDGVHAITATAYDVAGNFATQSGTVQYDATAPGVSLIIPAPNGANGWNRTPVVVTASGSDATSGLASVTINGAGSTYTVSTDGVASLTATAYDVAGNSATQSGTVQYDGTPPSLTVGTLSPDGSNGWFVSSVTVSASASDSLSGLSDVQHQVDGGGWSSGSSVSVSSDGSHQVEFQAIDAAGNVSSVSTQVVRLDKTPPQSTFTDPAEGSTTTVRGTVTLSGLTSDLTSGPGGAEISLDGGATWSSLSIGGGTWSYSWNTRNAANGTYTILVRAADLAGNEEHTASITVVVANGGTHTWITPSWQLCETAVVEIRGDVVPVTGARITVSDTQGHSRVYSYSVLSIPDRFQWDGMWDDGKYAPPGSYPVLLEAWDAFGNTAQTTGTVIVPSADAAPTVESVQETVADIQAMPQPAMTLPVTGGISGKPLSDPILPLINQVYIWPLFGLVSLFGVIIVYRATDRRHLAISALASAFTAESQKSQE